MSTVREAPPAAVDVVVVGAGMAGAAVADELARAGLSVLVLEARSRAGGRMWTRPGPTGGLIDVGGQWIGPGQRRVNALVDELGLVRSPQPTRGKSVLRVHGRTTRYRGIVPLVSPHRLVDLQMMLWQLDRMAARLDPAAPWQAADARRLDALTVGAWARSHARTQVGATLLRLAVHAVWAVEPDQLSMLTLLQYVRAAGGAMPLLTIEGGAQEHRIVGGSQQLATRLLDRAVEHGAAVMYESPVQSISHDGGPAHVSTATGVTRSRRVVLALAPSLVDRIHVTPSLPGERSRLQQRMPMGSAVKLHLAYERPFWRDAGLSGEVVTDEGPLRMAIDASRAGDAMLAGFVLADDAARFGTLARDEQHAAVTQQLAALIGPAARRTVGFEVQDWCAEQWTGGCYVGLPAPGALSRFGPALRDPVGPLHWAGTETATEWTGYIEGALESAQRASSEVLAAIGGGDPTARALAGA